MLYSFWDSHDFVLLAAWVLSGLLAPGYQHQQQPEPTALRKKQNVKDIFRERSDEGTFYARLRAVLRDLGLIG